MIPDVRCRHSASGIGLPQLRPWDTGEIVYLYAFDVANEVRLDRAAELLPAKLAPATGRERPALRDIPFPSPLNVELPQPAARLGGASISLSVRVYDVGVLGVIARLPFARTSLAELMPFHDPILDDGRPLDDLARRQCAEVV